MYPSDALCCSENFKPSWKPHCLSRRKNRDTIGRSLMHKQPKAIMIKKIKNEMIYFSHFLFRISMHSHIITTIHRSDSIPKLVLSK